MSHIRNCQKEKGFLASFLFHKPTREELLRKGDLPSLARLLRKQGPEKFLNTPLDGDGNTPLIMAAGRGSYRVVQWLVSQKGINLDARNRFGWTALYEAAGTGHRHVLERLVQAGADPTIPATSWPRHVPSQMAQQMGWNACVEVLVRAEKNWKALQRRKAAMQEEETKAESVLGTSQTPATAAAAAAAAREATGEKGSSEKNEGDLSSSSSISSSLAVAAGTAGKTRNGDNNGFFSSSSSTSNGKDVAAAAAGGTAKEAVSSAIITPSPPTSPSSFIFSSSSSSSSSPINPVSASDAVAPPSAPAPAASDKVKEETVAALASPPPPTPTNKTDLPACLRWQVEEGVGEGGHVGFGWEEMEDDWLEVHPAVFSKRGPRVGRRRREGTGAGSWVLGYIWRNKTLTNLAMGRTSGRLKARAGSRKKPRWVVRKE
ncbi:hypothetical protein VYU27_009439 [Nannochloropsis oceanica]